MKLSPNVPDGAVSLLDVLEAYRPPGQTLQERTEAVFAQLSPKEREILEKLRERR